jgi:hypothetical protein
MDPKLVTPFLVTGLLAWAIGRRMRRAFGRQPVRAQQMRFRIGVLALAAALAITGALRELPGLGALIAGLACGAVLGYVGLRHTQFDVTAEGRFYTPHTYIGLIVTALFLGRVAYRVMNAYHGAAFTGANPADPFAYHKSPLTLAMFGVLIGYYLLFNFGVLRKTKALAAALTATPANPARP